MPRWLLIGFAAAAAIVGLVWLIAGGDDRPDATIDDPAFVQQANDVCRETVPALRPPRRGGPQLSDDEVADRIDEVADGLDAVAVDLAHIPVTDPDDQIEVATWLEEWANYTGAGRAYADAIREGLPEDEIDQVEQAGQDSVRAIARFARANRIDDCVL